ncbi:glycoside hydrolase family 25 protein [Ochrobactrum sp. GPK 3]|uniref:glycoside hydrolase family 25 protein n=1 Tax=Brucella sp. 22210 TaxID=3453892 RepID=UPI00313858C7
MVDLDSFKKGIDVSRYQGAIDWHAVAAAGIQDAMIKMSEGGTYTDPQFEENWLGATAEKLSVGVYHYFRALSSTPQAQADSILKGLNIVGFDPLKNSLAIDVEEAGNIGATGDQIADNLYELLRLIGEHVIPGNRATIYASPQEWNSLVNCEKYDFSEYPLWVAHCNVKTPCLPKSWEAKGKAWVRWQYCENGIVSGIDAPVDLNWVK